MQNHSVKTIISSCLLFIFLPSITWALQVEEIIVTAQKKEESLSDVSIAVSAYTGDDLGDLGVADTTDLANIIPGFTFADSGANSPIYTLRGIGFNERSQTSSSTVGVYIDEVALPFPVLTKGANLDLARVEVLKGPQGTLYGRNSTGGAINYISKRPTETFEAGIKAEYSRFQTTDIEAFVSGPVTDFAGLRLAVRSIQRNEGWQRSLSRDPGLEYAQAIQNNDPNVGAISDNPIGSDFRRGEQDKFSLRLKWEWDASNTVSIKSSIDYWTDNSETQATQPFAVSVQSPLLEPTSLHPNILNQPLVDRASQNNRLADWFTGSHPDRDAITTPFFSQQEDRTGLPLSNPDIDDGLLMFSFRTDWDINESMSLTYLGAIGKYESTDSYLPISGITTTNSDTLQSVDTRFSSNELRLSGSGENNSWLLGLYYAEDSVDDVDTFLAETSSSVFNIGDIDVAIADIFGLLEEQTRGANPALLALIDTTLAELRALEFGELLGTDTLAFNTAALEVTQDSDIIGIFGSYEYFLNEEFKFTAGGRWTRESRDFTGCTRGTLANTAGTGVGPFFSLIQPVLSIIDGGDFTLPGLNPLEELDCVAADFSVNPDGSFDNLGRSAEFVDNLTESNFSFRLAIDWTPTDDSLFYASYARGFKSGSFPLLSASTNDQYLPVTQEQLDAFEIGTKLTLVDGLMKLNGAAFYYDYKDKQLLGATNDVLFGTLPRLDNVPKSTVQGAEADIQFSPIDGLYLSAAISYIETEIKEGSGVNELGLNEDFAGNEFNFAPKLEFTLLANYEFAITDNMYFSIGIDYSFTDDASSALGNTNASAEVFDSNDNVIGPQQTVQVVDHNGDIVRFDTSVFDLESYGIINARMSLREANDVWKVTLWGRNISNEFYVTNVLSPGDSFSRYTGTPKTYGISFSYNYF